MGAEWTAGIDAEPLPPAIAALGLTASGLVLVANDYLLSLGLEISEHQGVTSTAPTGEKYISIDAIGIREQGARRSPKDICPSKQDAVNAYLGALQRYTMGKAGTVYWRHPPLLERLYHGWTVYSRLLISDKPEIANAEQAA